MQEVNCKSILCNFIRFHHFIKQKNRNGLAAAVSAAHILGEE